MKVWINLALLRIKHFYCYNNVQSQFHFSSHKKVVFHQLPVRVSSIAGKPTELTIFHSSFVAIRPGLKEPEEVGLVVKKLPDL